MQSRPTGSLGAAALAATMCPMSSDVSAAVSRSLPATSGVRPLPSAVALRRPGRAILWGGLAAGLGDSFLALALYRAPITVIYQSVAGGLLGRTTFQGGLKTAALGMALHFFIATTAASVYVMTSLTTPELRRHPASCGLAFGMMVYFFMKYIVLPLSAVSRLGPFEPLALIGHALLVGLPIGLFTRRYVPWNPQS